MPSEVVPPMYEMLLGEISEAIKEKEPYHFTHYLIFSKTYREVRSLLNEEDTSKSKKQKKSGKRGPSEIFYFHPEDEILQKHSISFGSFDYAKEARGSDAKRTFQELGIKPEAHLIVIEAAEFEAAVKALENFFKQA